MIPVRAATANDGPRLAELHAIVHDLHVHARPDVFVTAPDPTRLQAFFQAALAEPCVHVLVAEHPHHDVVAGYALARTLTNDGGLHVRAHSAMKVEHLAVDPAAARNGIATALLDAVREIARAAACRTLTVNVWSFNGPARSFYEASGLTPTRHHLEQTL